MNYLYLIGYNTLKEYESEDGSIKKIKDFVEVATIKFKDIDKKKILKIFIEKNKEKLKKNNIDIKKLIIEKHKDLNFEEMVNEFRAK